MNRLPVAIALASLWSFGQTPSPQITPYLHHQVETAWRQDDQRLARLRAIRSAQDLQGLQKELRQKLLTMIGGLPQIKTPLNARITGTIQLDGYRIEKLIFESLPGFHVTALLYVPDGAAGRRPAILIPCGHTTNGKIGYQYLAHRLAKRGYVVLNWDAVGHGERSQFWDAAKSASRYNLVCGEHAVLGNLAYLAGANLARWEIWDGIRAFDYLLTRPEVDPKRISITGTSGGGFQAAHIAALDSRIHAAAPSCYLSALPMRMYNRIFKDPDSDPEQDLYGMVAQGVDHAGLMLLIYPRPLFVAAAVEDFFPVEGTRKTYREVAAVYSRFGIPEKVALAEGYHPHRFSIENQQKAFDFLDRFNGITDGAWLAEPPQLDEKVLRVTNSGQVLQDYKDGRSLMDLIAEYYRARKFRAAPALAELYRGPGYPGIDRWPVRSYNGQPSINRISWQAKRSEPRDGLSVDRYVLHHSERLAIPLLHIHQPGRQVTRTLLWFSSNSKDDPANWPELSQYVAEGFQVVAIDVRGQGEDRMAHPPGLSDETYASPLAGVLANYVYNSLLTGRPYVLQMLEDGEIAARFARLNLKATEVLVSGTGQGYTLAVLMAQAVGSLKLLPRPSEKELRWSQIVEQKREIWPIQYLLPGGAYLR